MCYTDYMSKRTEEKQTLENILRLDSLRDKLHGADLRKLDAVIDDLRNSVGETVSKSNAAEMFQVSRQTVDQWIHKDLLPSVRSQSGRQRIPRPSFEKAIQEVRSLDSSKPRAALSEALRALASDIAPPKKKVSKTSSKPAAKKSSAPASKKKATKTAKKAAGSSSKATKKSSAKTTSAKKTSAKK